MTVPQETEPCHPGGEFLWSEPGRERGEACNRAKRDSHPSRVFPVNLCIYLRGGWYYYSFFTAEESEAQR